VIVRFLILLVASLLIAGCVDSRSVETPEIQCVMPDDDDAVAIELPRPPIAAPSRIQLPPSHDAPPTTPDLGRVFRPPRTTPASA
jgi:hypothetical protein